MSRIRSMLDLNMTPHRASLSQRFTTRVQKETHDGTKARACEAAAADDDGVAVQVPRGVWRDDQRREPPMAHEADCLAVAGASGRRVVGEGETKGDGAGG